VSAFKRRTNLAGGIAAGLLGAVVLALPASAAAAAPPAPPTSRLEGAFDMKAKILRTKNIQGEKKGQKYSREWKFAPSCATGVCTKVKLNRSLKDGKHQKLTLKWDGKKYASKMTLKEAGICGGKTVKNAGTAVVKISATVTETVDYKGTPVSTKITGTFAADHKIVCPGGSLKASTASSLTGTRSDPPKQPKPPTADFERSPESGSLVDGPVMVSFYDTSFDDDGGNIVAWSWNFGDGSPTDTTQNPSHQYTAAGTYNVTLTVTDSDDGLTATQSRTVQIDP
jgi:hypothetical protein